MVVVGLTVIELTPDAPFDHVTVPLQPVWLIEVDCPAQIVTFDDDKFGGKGFGLTVTLIDVELVHPLASRTVRP